MNVGDTPYSEKHKRVFNFSRLNDIYGRSFSERVATTFVSLISDLAAPKLNYYQIIHFLLWLSKESQLYGEIVAGLKNNKHIDEAKFERAVLQYRQAVISRVRRMGKMQCTAQSKFSMIQKFAGAGVFPQFRLTRTKWKGRFENSRPRPSLVEATQRGEETKDIAQQLQSTAAYFDVNFDAGKDTMAFAENLAREIHQREDLPKDLSQAICVICEERLTALRVAASKIFRDWQANYDLGRQFISRAQVGGREIYRTLENARSSKTLSEYRKTVSRLFPKHDSDIALHNLLVVVSECFNGVYPSRNTHEWGAFWHSLYMKVGGKRRVQAFLSPPRLVTSAVICLYLCETGVNESVALSMMSDALRPSEIPKHLTTVGNKVRAKGKPIYDELPLESTITGCTSAAEAMTFYQTVTNRYRSKNTKQTKRLFLYVENSKIKQIEEWQLRLDFFKITAESRELTTLWITPSMIRPTVLLVAHLKNPMNLGVTQLLARHEKEETTLGYVRKLPHRVILYDNIREYQDTLQDIALSKNKKAWDMLSIEHNTWITASKRAQRTGLGIFCSNPMSGAQPDYPKGNTCQALDRCITCPLMIVVAEPESIADMIIWKKALDSIEDKFLEEHYERWEKVWVIWKAFIQVVLDEKMARGEHAKIKIEAERLANQRMQSEDFTIPVPW